MKQFWCSIVIGALCATNVYADTMTNQVAGLYNITQVPTATNPVLCVQQGSSNQFVEWKYNTSLDPNKISGNPYYFGAAIRNGGCTASDLYFGYISVSGTKITYQPTAGSHIQFSNGQIANNTISGQLAFTPIGPTDQNVLPTNPNHSPTDQVNWFTGINLSGLEFSTIPNDTVLPNLSKADEATANSDLAATATFLNQGANTIRLPIRWAYLQPQGPNSSTFDMSYFNDLVKPTLEAITSHGYNVILDLHSYMHYATIGNQVAGCGGPDGKCPDGTLITDPNAYVNVWSKIWQAIKADPSINQDHILLDLVNEPTDDQQLKPQDAFNMQVAVIKALNNQGFTGYYLVEGTHWSGLHSWEDSGNAAVFTRANFLKAGLSASDINHIMINVHQYLDADYSGTGNSCLTNIYTTGSNGFNLQAFVDYLQANQFKAIITEFGVGSDQTTCAPTLNDFLTFIKDHAYNPSTHYGFMGWTVWSTGHGWENYNLRVKPNDWKDNILTSYFNQ